MPSGTPRYDSHLQQHGESIMRISELTAQQKDALIAKCVAGLMEHHRVLHGTQAQIVGCLVGAGFCACGALSAIVLANGRGLAFVASLPWHSWLLVFGIVGASLFVIAWSKFMVREVTMRAGERAWLIWIFEKCAKDNIEFSAEDVIAFLRSVPDSKSLIGTKRRS